MALAQDTIDFIDAVVGGPAHLVGHSVGAGAVLHAALRDLVCRDQAIVVERPADEDQAADKVRGDLRGVGALTLVMASDDDIITLEHTLALYRVIKDSELAVVPGTSHFLTQEKPDLCNGTVVDFLASDPLATVAPMRRVPSGSAA